MYIRMCLNAVEELPHVMKHTVDPNLSLPKSCHHLHANCIDQQVMFAGKKARILND